MQIENEVKLDFKDVLIKPKRSVLVSRSKVDLNREYIFKHSGQSYSGIPIIAANMDTIGTFNMAIEFSKHNMMVALHKHYSVDELKEFWKTSNNVFYSLGIADDDIDKLLQFFTYDNESPEFICLDVANGYSEKFVEVVQHIRKMHPKSTLMAGNVVTSEMTEALILAGADVVKVGIGPGCFVPGTKIRTKNGLKPIEEIMIGDEVLTHTNQWKKVTKTIENDGEWQRITVPTNIPDCKDVGRSQTIPRNIDECDKDKVINVNNIKATPTHEFYVVDKKDAHLVNEENIHQYAKWIQAKYLTKEHVLIEL